MLRSLINLRKHLRNQSSLIQSKPIDLIDKITLIRSVLENYAIFNFLKSKHTHKRIQLFKCFGDLEWYSHQIYFSFSIQERPKHFLKFLMRIKNKYPFGYTKYVRLIKRRCCKKLRYLIGTDYKPNNYWLKQLKLLNSDKKIFTGKQQLILANYMSHHLITKLPFPYRIVFGKSITYFVLKYSPVHRNTYWLLSDLSHGLLIENNVNTLTLTNLIKKILQIIDTRVNQN